MQPGRILGILSIRLLREFNFNLPYIGHRAVVQSATVVLSTQSTPVLVGLCSTCRTPNTSDAAESYSTSEFIVPLQVLASVGVPHI